MLSILAPVLVLVLLAMLIAVGVFVVGRLRAGEPVHLAPSAVLLAYLHVMTLTGLLTCTLSLSGGLKVALASAFGSEFSYYQPPVAVPVPAPVDGIGAKPAFDDSVRAAAQAELQRKQDMIQAATGIVVGLLLFATHNIARNHFGGASPTLDTLLRRGYTTILLAIFGIAGVVSLIMGVQELLQYWLLPAVDQFSYRNPPGASVAAAIVFVPAWLFFLQQLVRQSRKEG